MRNFSRVICVCLLSLGLLGAAVRAQAEATVLEVSSSTPDGSYNAGDTIAVTVTFTEAVTVGGGPRIQLETGATDRFATYASGSGGDTLTFNYLVVAGDVSADLDYLATNALQLNGGSIVDGGSAAANLTLSPPGSNGSLRNNKDIVIDTTVPTLSSVSSSTPNGSYTVGEIIPIILTFSEAVLVTGTPFVTVETGTVDRQASFDAGSGTNVLVFLYTVQAGDTSLDLNLQTPMNLNGGTVTDLAGNNYALAVPTGGATSLAGAKAIIVDTSGPVVLSVLSPLGTITLGVGSTVDVQVLFNEAVTVDTSGGSPRIALATGTTTRYADYVSGSGTNTLLFNYVIQPGDFSTDLAYTSTTALEANGATLRDALGNAAPLTLAAPGAAGSLNANEAIQVGPIVVNVTASTANGRYTVGEAVLVQVEFSEDVTVTGGPPLLQLETGATDRQVLNTGGSGTNVLEFNYVIGATETSGAADLNYLGTGSLTLNGGTIRNVNANAAFLTLPALAGANSLSGNKDIQVDTLAPTVTTIVRPTGVGQNTSADQVVWRVTFLDNGPGPAGSQGVVNVDPTDFSLAVTAGAITGASVTAVTPVSALIYDVTVDTGTGNGTLVMNVPGTATIEDIAGTPFVTAFNMAAGNSYIIDKTAPVITNFTSGVTNGSFRAGQTIDMQLTFSKAVTLAPVAAANVNLTLETGTTDQTAVYQSGSGGVTITMRYVVQAGDTAADLDAIAANALSLQNGATLRDVYGNDANLTLPVPGGAGSLSANKDIKIDTDAPTVINVSSATANNTYTTGAAIQVAVQFSEPVFVTGAPRIQLETGNTDQLTANATPTGTGTDTLVFTYTVVAGDTSPDLDYLSTTALNTAGTILDGPTATANSADRTLPAPGGPGSLSANKAIVVNTNPTVLNITSTQPDDTYSVGTVIPIQVTFSEPVNITGTPTLTLNTTPAATASYAGVGSGTSTITFNYTIALTQQVADLNATVVNLAGGTILAVDNNAAATLTLPPAGNQLNSNKNLRIDAVAPVVASVNRLTPTGTNTNADPVVWRVTFTESVPAGGPFGVQNVDIADFTPVVTAGAITGASVTSVTPVSTLIYDVEVDTGSGNGTLRLDVLTSGGATIQDLAGTPYAANYVAGQTYVIDKTAPVITNFTSAVANGSFRAGQTIDMQLTFSKAVTLAPVAAANVNLTLETGTTDQTAVYQSGSGGVTITMRYVVQAGDTAADLDAIAANALSLQNGATLRDVYGNDANLTLPVPGGAGSLSANKDIKIDTDAPTVINVSSATANGTYTTGNAIQVAVQFSETVYVTGAPRIQLETGNTDQLTANATPAGNGTDTLVFTYTVVAGDSSPDLDYLATNALNTAGTIRDGNTATSNDADRTLPAPGGPGSLSANKAIVVNTNPTVLNITSTQPDDTYSVGTVIPIQVTFSEPVNITGTPTLTLNTSPAATASYAGVGSGTSTITFNYTIALTQQVADLNATAVNLAGGTILAVDNNAAATLTLPPAANQLSSNKNLRIDAVAPVVASVNRLTPTGTNTNADPVVWRVTFTENVPAGGPFGVQNVDIADFTPVVTAGAITGASVTSVTPVSTLIYDVEVDTGTGNGTLRLDVLTSGGATIQDLAGTPYAANYVAGQTYVIDKTAPVITNFTSGVTNGSFRAGQTIDMQLTFSKAVTLAPVAAANVNLTLETGTTDQTAVYQSGSGGVTITMRYVVQAGDTAADLDAIAANALSLQNGATLRDGFGNDADLTLPTPGAAGSLSANKDIKIDTEAPTVINVTSSTPNATYTTGNPIEVAVQFSEPVYVTGAPRIQMETGNTDQLTANATPAGNGTDTLLFTYTVVSGDYSLDLDYLADTALNTAGTIRDGNTATSNDAVRTLPTPGGPGSLSANKAIVVNTLPTVINVTSPKADGLYKLGDIIPIHVQFSEPVDVTGFPQIQLETGTVDRQVPYSSGTGTDTLVFDYTVQTGDTTGAVNVFLTYVGTGSLTLNGGTIRDTDLNNATLTLPAIAAVNSLRGNKNLRADGIVPTVTATGVNSANAAGTYQIGDMLTLVVNFSEAVVVDTLGGIPRLVLETGPVDRNAFYSGGTGTTALSFNYFVADGDRSSDLDYVSALSLSLSGGTIKDLADNDAVVTLANPGTAGSLAANEAFVIDGVRPQVVSVSSNQANGSYGLGQVIDVRLSFAETVTVVGVPQLVLETGSTDRTIDYLNGTGTTQLTFRYTVQAGDNSPDLDYVNASALSLNGGSLQDANTNDATLTLPVPGTPGSLSANKDLRIDTTQPTISNIALSIPAVPDTNNASVTYSVTFDEPVTGVTAADFALVSTGVTGATIGAVSGSGADWTVAVNTGSGNGTIGLNAAAGDGPGVDAVGLLRTGAFTGPEYRIDKTVPAVTQIQRSVPAAATTNAATVTYAVTFSEPVTGVSAFDFTLATAGGITGASIGTVSGSGTDWTVDVNTGTGNGTVTLSTAASAGPASDAAGNLRSGFFLGQQYTLDKIAPVISSIQRSVPLIPTTNAATVTYSVLFSKAVTGVTAADFALVTSGITGASIGTIAGSGTTWTVQVNTGAGSGTLGLDAAATDGPAVDAVGNLRTGSFSGQLYTIDKVAPEISAINRSVPLAAATNAGTVTYAVSFTKPVTGVSAADFALVSSGVTGANIGAIAGTGTDWTVDVNTGSGSGSIGLDAAPADGPAADGLGNLRTGSFTGEVYTLDRDAPAITAIDLSVPAVATTNAASLVFAVTFSEAVTGVDAADFALVSAGVSGATIDSVAGAGTDWLVTVDSGSGSGTLGLNAAGSDGPAVDAVGNARSGAFSGAVYTLDKTGPAVTGIVLQGPNPTNSTSVSFDLSFDDDVLNFDATDLQVSVTGTGLGGIVVGAPVNVGIGAYTVTITGIAGGANGGMTLGIAPGNDVTDALGNPLQATAVNASVQVNTTIAITGPLPTLVRGYVDGPAEEVSIVATGGVATLVYEWFLQVGADPPVSLSASPGGDTDTLSVDPPQFPAGISSVYCVVTDGVFTATSASAQIELRGHLQLTQGLQDAFAALGDSVTFSVGSEGGLGLITYEWLKEDGSKVLVPIPDADGPSYTIDPVVAEDAGLYQVVVSDAFGDSISSQATLTVDTVQLPVTGLLGLVSLAGLLGAGGSLLGRRRRPRK